MQLLVASKIRWLASLGPDGVNAVAPALNRYCAAVQQHTGTAATIVYPDDPASVSSYRVGAAVSSDGYAMAQVLWQIFAAPGSDFTSVLILGGPDIFPLISVENPVRKLKGFQADPDAQILTDNYYGAVGQLLRDLLAPALAIGRLVPRTASAANMVAALDSLAGMYADRPLRQGSLAVSTDLWEADTDAVVAPIAADIRLAPDYQIPSSPPAPYEDLRKQNLHFNLHGFPDDSTWMGEADWGATQCIVPGSFRNQYVAGSVIFAENCYGAYIVDKSPDNSCARRALAQGAASFVGSTTYAWGHTSLDAPGKLANADLLGSLFWTGVKGGKRPGIALRDAKRQFLAQALAGTRIDELQYKTLFQFLLLGDPLL